MTKNEISTMSHALSIYFNECIDGLITREEYMVHSNEFLVAFMDFCDADPLSKDNDHE